MRKKLVALVLAATMMVGTVGCRYNFKTVIPEPPAVVFERNLVAAADAVDVVATGLIVVNEARKSLEATDQISREQSQNILNALKAIAIKNQAAADAIMLAQVGGSSASDNGWRKALLDVVTEARKIDPSVFAVKNPTSQATLKAALATLQAALMAIEASFGGK